MSVGTILAPTYLGDDAYQLSIFPDATLRYTDRLTVSLLRGVSFTVLNIEDFAFGVVGRYNFGRNENGNSPLRIAGAMTDDLNGLAPVDFTIELGGFVQYSFDDVTARLEVRQGLNGHQGLTGTAEFKYSTAFPIFGQFGFLQLGPEISFGDNRYMSAFFDVTEAQSTVSGLPAYDANWGLLSYGFKVNAVLPIYGGFSTTLVAGYELLAGDANDSSLVEERGSRNQAIFGLLLNYQIL